MSRSLWQLVKTGEPFLPSLLENIFFGTIRQVDAQGERSKGGGSGEKRMTQIIEIFLRACKSVNISSVSFQLFSALIEVAKLKSYPST